MTPHSAVADKFLAIFCLVEHGFKLVDLDLQNPMPTDGQTEEEWTRVKTKSRYRKGPRNVPLKPAAAQKAGPDEAPNTQTVADIAAEYETFRLRWHESEASRRLKETISANAKSGQAVGKAACLGIGTFDPDHGGWDAKRRTYIQLVAFLDMVEHLSEYSNAPIACMFQEPRFSASDKEFIQSLGHKVVESPAAFDAVDDHTLLFAVHMYRPIYEAALEKALPAAFVGTGWDTWDDVGNMKEGDFACMRAMHESHRLLPFPQDGSHTTFSSTCLYWLPRIEQAKTEDDVDNSVRVEMADEELKAEGTTDTVERADEELQTGSATDTVPASHSGTEGTSSKMTPS